MILTRNFEITLYINNPISFCANKQHNVKLELENNYVGKCFQGVYILEILEVLQVSKCRINNVSLTNNSIIDVKFTANVFLINKWEIIIGAEIIKNQSLLIGVYKKNDLEIDITFMPTTVIANTISLGQIVPIRVIESLHKSRTNKIAVAGVLLTCDIRSEIYKNTTTEINKAYLPEIYLILDDIKQELSLRKTLVKNHKEKVIFFEKLLYSYKASSNQVKSYPIIDDLTYEGLSVDMSNEVMNIFDMVYNQKSIGYWHRPLTFCRSSPFVLFTTTKPQNFKVIPLHIIIIEFAKPMLSFLVAIRELVETYNSPELISSHENIWNIMKLKQI